MNMRKFTYISLICTLLCAGNLRAQEKGVPSESLSAAWAPVKVDHHIGIRGGYAMAKARFEPTQNTEMLTNLMFGGISYKFDIPKQKYVGMIEIDINLTQKGYSRNYYFESPEVEQRKYTEIEIPILWQPYLPLGKKGSKFYLSAGPFVNYAIKSKIRENYDKEANSSQPWETYEYDTSRDNRWGYGITFGGGFMIMIKQRWSVSFETRYNIGLSDILKGVEKVPENLFFRSPVDQLAISFGVNYMIRQSGGVKKSKKSER